MASIVSAGTTSATSLNLSADTSGVLQLASNNGTVALTVDTSQNVGIGTSSPDSKLAVYNATGTSQFRFGASSSYYWDISRDNDVTGNLLFSNNNATSRTTRMVIDTSGNVGIGTSSPDHQLEVSGTSTSTTTLGVGISVENGSFTTNTRAGIVFRNSDNYGASVWSPRTGSSAGALVFGTNGGGGTAETNIAERARIDSSGRVGVGTTSPNGRFTVASNGGDPNTNLNNFAITTFGAYGGGIFMLDSADPNSGTGYAIWTDDNGNDFNIARGSTSSSASGGVFINNSAGSWSSRSDERDKINLMPIEGALGKVSQLRAVTGEYIWAEGARHPFLIAQDVQAVLPEAVCVANKSATPEDQRLGVSYTDIIPLLVAAIKELNAKVTALENK